jgi:hypothetical protein
VSPVSRHTFATLSILLLSLLGAAHQAGGGTSEGEKSNGLRKIMTNESYRPFLVNNVFNYYGNNGDGSFNPYTSDNEGFEFPKGGFRSTTFEDGILWGGYHKGRATPTAGGSMYRHGLQAGKILTSGTDSTKPVADDPALPRYRIYRVRPQVNPGTPFDPGMESTLQMQEASLISHSQATTAREIYDQYIADWNEWPARDGAPFLDADDDGVYNPLVDVPGVPGADQTLWYVANDLDSARVYGLSGSPVIGIEMQKTIWGYTGSYALSNTIFIRTMLINRSGAPIDSMYIAQFADPDLGFAGDDYTGCDTTRNLSYVYNASDVDATYGSSVPAVGFTLLQGPMVRASQNDTAWFGSTRRRGFRNLALSAATMFTSGYVLYADPRQGLGGDIQLYRLFQGLTRDGLPFTNPITGFPSRFIFSGDPVTGTGWIEDKSFVLPNDRRILMASGPFTMTASDTQEVVIAHLAAMGPDRLSSITLLKSAVDSICSIFRSIPKLPLPQLRFQVGYPSASKAYVAVTADGRGSRTRSVIISLRKKDGTEAGQLLLSDDGLHGDGAANDGLFGGTLTINRELDPLLLQETVTFDQNETHSWIPALEPVTTAGPLLLGEVKIFSDNLNDDGKANNGEEIRYGISLHNGGAFTLTNLTCVAEMDTHRIALFPPSTVDSTVYNPSDPKTYFSVPIPSGYDLKVKTIPISIRDDRGNLWKAGLSFPVVPLPYQPRSLTITRLVGHATGDFQVLIVDPSQFRNHRYNILGVDSINAQGDPGFTLVDSTDGRVLLRNHTLPDFSGHTIPLTDGFKVARGSTWDYSGTMTDWTVPSGERPWSWSRVTNVLNVEGLNGTIGNAFDHWPSGGVGYRNQHKVLIAFAATDAAGNLLDPSDTTASFGYRYLANAVLPPAQAQFAPFIIHSSPGFAYQDFTRSLPFAAYDVESNPPRRLAVGYLENNVPAGTVDGKYWPPILSGTVDNGTPSGPREWFFIFDMTYDLLPSASLQVDIEHAHVPMMWFGYPTRRVASFPPGNQFTIETVRAPGTGDLWAFGLNHDDYLPSSYSLSQNFPNPFNPMTTIRYTLAMPSRVTLKIYNILGQLVRTLVDGSQYAGDSEVSWDGTGNNGVAVASGVYICRFEASSLTEPIQSLSETRKMVLVR